MVRSPDFVPVDALIFDLDGTLVDTLDDITEAMNAALAARGLATHPREAYRRFVGEGTASLAAKVLPAAEHDSVDALVASFRQHYERGLLRHSRPYPGIVDLLDHLRESAIPMAVLSNKPHPFTTKIVDALFPAGTFARVLGQRDGHPRKPDPASVLPLLDVLPAAPAAIGFVGDSDFDIDTAVGAGMRAIGVLWGFRDRAELEAAGAEVLLSQPLGLLPLVRRSPQ